MNDKLVLVTDDDAFMRAVICNALSEAGFDNIVEAKDGNEAVELYKEKHPELVILDITMPCKDGLTALDEIMTYDREARVIMCTSFSQESTLIEALLLGASDYVVKPFQREKLVESVRNALNN